MKDDSPCKECGRRGCGKGHDTCKQYQDWKQKNNALGADPRTDYTIKRRKRWEARQ